MQPHVVANVRAELRRRGWRQRELADRSGLPAEHISNLLRGQRDWWLRDLWFVSKALGMDILDLFPMEDHRAA